MKVLVPLDNRGGGGVARVGFELARAMAECMSPDERLVVLTNGLEAVDWPHTDTIRRLSRPQIKVVARIADQLSLIRPSRGVDIVHAMDAKAPLLVSGPFTMTVHDVHFLDHPEWFPQSVARYKHALLRASLRRRPALIACVSHHTAERLRFHYPEQVSRMRIEVIYPGVSVPMHPIPACPPVDGYFLTVSAIEPRKNHLGLLAAFQQARAEGFALRWKVVGRPQYGGRRIAEQLAAAEGVDVLGRVDDGELDDLYAGACFVATPSFEEGFGLPPLEAMVRGIPVISSTGSALDESVGDGGLRVRPDDTAEWVEGLKLLGSDESLRRRLATAGRAQAARFTWRNAAASYLAVFREVTAASSARDE